MPEHTVIVDSLGGTKVLSCEALQIKTIEYPFKELTAEGIKRAILQHKFLTEETCGFDLLIVDNRPEPVNFNEQRTKESKEFKSSHNQLYKHEK